MVGVVLDERYRLDGVLGEGGMGAVFRAHHLAMDRRVAVKLLKPHLTGDERALERFAREARSTLKVDSPHAVKVLDFGVTPLNDYYMVLEYIDGRTVQREIEIDGVFTPARAVHVAKHVLAALGAAHATGLVHRDIKPDNIILMRVDDDPDFAKVLDFGVAKLMEGHARSSRSALALTQAGMVFGTPEFMSPEQACGQPLDGRSDLYSLAATMFAMLTGCGMYPAKSIIEWLTAHARDPAPHLADALPQLAAYPELDRVLQRCLAKNRNDRPRDAAELTALLDELVSSFERPVERLLASVTLPAPQLPAPPLPFAPSPSNYVAAITTDTGAVATTTSVTPVHRRGRLLAVTALAVVGVIAATIVVAVTKREPARTTEPPPPHGSAIGKTIAPAPDASAPPPDVAVAVVPVDAPMAVAVAPPDAPHAVAPPTTSEFARHLAAAEAAARDHNMLGQLAEADAALRINPNSARARMLAADVMLQSGDLERGCKYLRMLKRNPDAAARARAAGCPGD
jgi:serine/threonine-protein kinase